MKALINEREQIILKTLVESYIRQGQPIGSRNLAQESGLDLSAATIRNVMSDLERMGLIHAPHTSAGRVPTAQGYRLFVDSLLTLQPLENDQLHQIKAELDPDSTTSDLLSKVSTTLSSLTQLAGVVMVPRSEQQAFRHVEFLPLSEHRILVIWVVNDKDVQNRIVHVERDYSESELTQMANYLNAEFAGLSLLEIQRRLLAELRETQASMNEMMRHAIEVASKTFESSDAGPTCVLDGQSNLLGYAEMSDAERLRQLFDAFHQKNELLSLLDRTADAEGIQIFIGEESGYEVFDGCSFISAPYSADGEVLGVLGVIGPTRISYDRVIPVVDITAKLLGAALKRR